MNKRFLALLLILSFVYFKNLEAQGIATPEIAVSDAQVLQTVEIPEKESTLRRTEIIFMLSLPFSAIMTFLVMSAAYIISDPAYINDLKMTHLPQEIIPYSIFTAVFVSGIVTYVDYRTVQGKKAEEKGRSEDKGARETHFGLGFEKKF